MIPTIEPSIKNGMVYYQEGEKVAVDDDWGINYSDMESKAKKFAPDRCSDMASIYELAIWYAYRVAKGYWNIAEICDNSSYLGNYVSHSRVPKKLDVAGKKWVGGARDGIGNTFKCVTNGYKF